jgi:UDP-2,4-diacetamido-2,4,6-trideoxy-beta-L-altropyranose hydrolase
LQPHPVDWLIVDHYSLDARWENALSGGYAQLMVIDDLANRPHRCDLLLDQTLGCTPEAYQSLTPIGSTLLTGTQFAVLRPEFAHWRAESLTRRNHCDTIQRIVLSLGGADPDNITGAFLENLRTSPLPESIELVIILGAQSPWQETIAHLARTLPNPTSVLIGVSNMAEILSQSDLAIGAAGTSSWERCCLGVPTLQVVIAENQAMIARQLEQAGAVIPITLSGHRPLSEVISGVTQAQLTSLSQHAARLVDGMGAQRVANTLLDLSKIGPDYE